MVAADTMLVGSGSSGSGGDNTLTGSSGSSGSHHGGTDAYYREMIEANPANPLLLANYAKFLKEVYNINHLRACCVFMSFAS